VNLMPVFVPLSRLIPFLASGVPGRVLSVAVNSALVAWLQCPKPLAYLIALLVQTVINYYLCGSLFFRSPAAKSPIRRFVHYAAGVAGFRLADWAVYVALVEAVHLHFLVAHLLNIALQSIPKYKFSESVFARMAQEQPTADAGLPAKADTCGNTSQGLS